MASKTKLQGNVLLIGLILILVPLLQSQTPSDAVVLKGTVSETTVLSTNDFHVWLQGERSGSEVCLGSKRFLENQGLLPAVGNSIEVTGVRVGNGSLLVASSLQMGGTTIKLRTSQEAQASSNLCPNGGCCGCGCSGYASQGNGHHCDHHGYGQCCDHE